MVFKDDYKHLRRMEVFLDENQLRPIRHVLETPGMELERQDKMNFFKWMSNQSIKFEIYNYDIYQREG
jgi:hypothetical protein